MGVNPVSRRKHLDRLEELLLQGNQFLELVGAFQKKMPILLSTRR